MLEKNLLFLLQQFYLSTKTFSMISRRKFLTQAGLLTTATVFSKDLFAENTHFNKRKIGLQLYSLRDEIPVAGLNAVLKKIAAAGYNTVEMYGFNGKNGFFDKSSKETAALLKANNLIAPSGHYGIESFSNGGQQQIDAALTLGHKYIVIPSLPDEMRKNLDGYKAVSEKLNKIGTACKKNKLKLAYHNHAFEFEQFAGQSQTGFDVMLKETDAALVNFEMDVFWIVTGGRNPLDLFKQHPGRFKLWHVKDMDKVNKDLNTEIGAGSIDFKPIFAQAKLSGLDYYFVEQENFSMDSNESIKKSNSYIRKNFLK